ncbi:MAG: MipA/OmpV family protein [Acidobacteria bacterium]|nr:MipA/OmpV family protein [Acidobacteriota bacterium]
MEERSPSMDADVEIVCSARPIVFRADFLTDTLCKSNGREFALQALAGARLWKRGIVLFGIGSRWLSQNRVDYYYGVRNSETAQSRIRI